MLDHSNVGEDGSPRGARRNTGKQPARDAAVDEVWRLEEVEESVLLEVFITALRRTKHEATGGKKVSDYNLGVLFRLNPCSPRVKTRPSRLKLRGPLLRPFRGYAASIRQMREEWPT